jgi:hypothetical protein
MAVAAMFHIIGSTLAAASVNYPMFLVTRLFPVLAVLLDSQSFRFSKSAFDSRRVSISRVNSVGELAPAHSRGRMVSFTVFGIDSGYFMSTTLSLAFSFVDHPDQWWLNFITGIIYNLCLLVSLIWISESPRWLAMQGRHDQAYKILEAATSQ